MKEIDNDQRTQLLKQALLKALNSAQKYLQPQPLNTSDEIAEEIRKVFSETGYSITIELLRPCFVYKRIPSI